MYLGSPLGLCNIQRLSTMLARSLACPDTVSICVCTREIGRLTNRTNNLQEGPISWALNQPE